MLNVCITGHFLAPKMSANQSHTHIHTSRCFICGCVTVCAHRERFGAKMSGSWSIGRSRTNQKLQHFRTYRSCEVRASKLFEQQNDICSCGRTRFAFRSVNSSRTVAARLNTSVGQVADISSSLELFGNRFYFGRGHSCRTAHSKRSLIEQAIGHSSSRVRCCLRRGHFRYPSILNCSCRT